MEHSGAGGRVVEVEHRRARAVIRVYGRDHDPLYIGRLIHGKNGHELNGGQGW